MRAACGIISKAALLLEKKSFHQHCTSHASVGKRRLILKKKVVWRPVYRISAVSCSNHPLWYHKKHCLFSRPRYFAAESGNRNPAEMNKTESGVSGEGDGVSVVGLVAGRIAKLAKKLSSSD